MCVSLSFLDREMEKETLAKWYLSRHPEELRAGAFKSSGYIRHLTNIE